MNPILFGRGYCFSDKPDVGWSCIESQEAELHSGQCLQKRQLTSCVSSELSQCTKLLMAGDIYIIDLSSSKYSTATEA